MPSNAHRPDVPAVRPDSPASGSPGSVSPIGPASAVGSTIDLNADLGEGLGPWSMGDDDAMLEIVTTANIACGGHAGDPSTMRRALASARARGVAVTAHVAYPDLTGFGRRFVDMSPQDLTDTLIAQIGALSALAAAEGTAVRGVKPHGALYNAIAHHEGHARAVVDALSRPAHTSLPLVAAPGAIVAGLAEDAGIPVVLEAFADRGYRPDGTLVPRREPDAVITDEHAIVDRVLMLAVDGQVRAADGTLVSVRAQSICLHGDTPGAVHLAGVVRSALEHEGITLRSAV
jgi:UPF0271 protein